MVADPPDLRAVRPAWAIVAGPGTFSPAVTLATDPPQLNWRRETGRMPVFTPFSLMSGGFQPLASILPPPPPPARRLAFACIAVRASWLIADMRLGSFAERFGGKELV